MLRRITLRLLPPHWIRRKFGESWAQAEIGHSNPLSAQEAVIATVAATPQHNTKVSQVNAPSLPAFDYPTVPTTSIFQPQQTSYESFVSNPNGNCCEPCCSERWQRAWCGPPPALNFRSDMHHAWRTLGDDAKSVLTWKNMAVLGIGAGAAVAIHQDWDGKVRDYTAEHPSRWGQASQGIGYLGDFTVQIPALAGLYAYSLWDQNEPLHDLSGALIGAYGVTTTTTTLIKVAVNTDRPSNDFNDGKYGFPSYHTASSFALASVLDEYYGHEAGLPAYILAGVIGWTRIDERDHDLSDVVFGAVLGTVIGKSVARHHLDSKVDVLPYYDPQNQTTGVTLGFNY